MIVAGEDITRNRSIHQNKLPITRQADESDTRDAVRTSVLLDPDHTRLKDEAARGQIVRRQAKEQTSHSNNSATNKKYSISSGETQVPLVPRV